VRNHQLNRRGNWYRTWYSDSLSVALFSRPSIDSLAYSLWAYIPLRFILHTGVCQSVQYEFRLAYVFLFLPGKAARDVIRSRASHHTSHDRPSFYDRGLQPIIFGHETMRPIKHSKGKMRPSPLFCPSQISILGQ